jgi:hypothetical protein
MNYPRILSFDDLPPYPVIRRTTPVSCHSTNYPRILSFEELPPYPVIRWTTTVSCHSMSYPVSYHSMNYSRFLSFDELPPYPVIRKTTPRILSFDELPPVSRKMFHIPQRASQDRRSTDGDRVHTDATKSCTVFVICFAWRSEKEIGLSVTRANGVNINFSLK